MGDALPINLGWVVLVVTLFFATFGLGYGLALLVYLLAFLFGGCAAAGGRTRSSVTGAILSVRPMRPSLFVPLLTVTLLCVTSPGAYAQESPKAGETANHGAVFADDNVDEIYDDGNHHLGAGGTGDIPKCSRELSRHARQSLAQLFDSKFDFHNAMIPDECPLNSPRSVYWHHESTSHRMGSHEDADLHPEKGQWLCGVCGKSFNGRPSLDVHLDEKHSASLHDHGPCLADYCDILRCDAFAVQHTAKLPHLVTCDEGDMAALREKCERVISTCLPSDQVLSGAGLRQFESSLRASVCEPLTCGRYWNTPSRNHGEKERAPWWKHTWWIYALCVGAVVVFVGLLYAAGKASEASERETAQLMRDISGENDDDNDRPGKMYYGDEEYLRRRINT